MVLPAWLDHLVGKISHIEVTFKLFCPSVKTSCPRAGNVNETPDILCNSLRQATSMSR